MKLFFLFFIFFFFFNDTATTEIYTLSLHDALPIYARAAIERGTRGNVLLPRRPSSPGCPSSRASPQPGGRRARRSGSCAPPRTRRPADRQGSFRVRPEQH